MTYNLSKYKIFEAKDNKKFYDSRNNSLIFITDTNVILIVSECGYNNKIEEMVGISVAKNSFKKFEVFFSTIDPTL